MSAYLARLKQLESVKNSLNVPNTEPPKPPEAPFDPFGGTHPGHIEKIFIANISENDGAALLLCNGYREARRQKVIAMLEAAPETQRAIYTDTASDPHNVILTIAVRNLATCEMLISKEKYDPWRLLEMVERYGAQNVH